MMPAASRMVMTLANTAPSSRPLITFRPSSALLHAEQEHEEEDVVVDQPGLELDAARDEVIVRDTR